MENNIVLTSDVKCPVPLSTLERQICELYAIGKTRKEVSAELGIPPSTITKLLGKHQVLEFVNELVMAHNFATKAERVRMLGRIVEDKIDALPVDEETGKVDFSQATSKDVVDVVKTIDDILKEEEKKRLGTSDNNTYINILNGMMNTDN